MFKIKQIVSVHTDQRNPPKNTPEEPRVRYDEVFIKFADNQSTIFNREQFQEYFEGISLPPEQKELNLSNIDHSLFTVIASLVIEKKTLHQALPEDFCQSPDICEELLTILERLTPKDKDHYLSLICSQIAYLTLPQAIQVMQAYEEDEKSAIVKERTIPRLVQEAQTTLMQAKLFFSDQQTAASFFLSRQIYLNELSLCQMIQKNLGMALLNPRNEMEKRLLTQQQKAIKSQISLCESNLNNLNKQLDVSFLSICAKNRILQFTSEANPEIGKIVAIAKRQIEEYGQLMLKALEESEADMRRTDLIEWIAGPKGFLLDYYGLLYDSSSKKEFPFIGPGKLHAGYRLANEGPYALEEEIRNDILQFNKNYNLPKRLISIDTRTKQLSEEVKKLYPVLLPFFKKFPNPETQKGTDVYKEVMQILWKFNGWDKLGVPFEDIVIETVDRNKDPFLVKGTVTLRGFELQFHFFLDDLIFLIPHSEDHLTPDSVSTREMIEYHLNPRRRYFA